MPSPPTFQKVNPAAQPILYLALRSSALPLSEVDEHAETTIAQRISMIRGVAQVVVYGAQKYAVRVRLDPRELASREMGIDEVAGAIARANVNLPTGVLEGPTRVYVLDTRGELLRAAAFRPIVVAYRGGAPVRLDDIADVEDSVENDHVASYYNGDRAIVLAIQKQPGTNTVAVIDAISRLLPKLRGEIPASVELDTLYDRSLSIRASVKDVEHTLLVTMVLVVLVIYLFLRDAAATFVASVALPVSIVGTFAGMWALGFSLDNLSLLALSLSVGFVVDDAIVVLENVFRHLEMGKSPLRAALDGAAQIGFTVVSMTLSLVVVFVPVLFMGGILGRLMREFAITMSIAILVSGLLSLTTTPMLASRILKKQRDAGAGSASKPSLFERLQRAYAVSLGHALGHRVLVLLVLAATIAGTAILVVLVPKGLFPSEDTGQLFALTRAAQGTSFAAMGELQREATEIVSGHPAVASVMSSYGAGGPSAAGNTGRLFIRMKDRRPGRETPEEIIAELRPKLAQIPGLEVYLQNPPPIRLGGQVTRSAYQLTLTGSDIDALHASAEALRGEVQKLSGLVDVTSDLDLATPRIELSIDRDRAAVLGVSAQSIEEALSSAYSGRIVSTIFAPTNQYRVIMGVDPRFSQNPDALALLHVRAVSGELVPLSSVSRSKEGAGPLSVNHLGQLPAVTISWNLAPGVSLGDSVARVSALARERLPETIGTSFQGSTEVFASSVLGLGVLILIAVLVIYVVLGILYESFIHPITILSGLPAAGFGALLALLVLGQELDVYSFVGVLLLVGIVKKNAIMMIDFALDAERREKISPAAAITEGARIRFRPIMMTTMAALAGSLPIALGWGAGAESRRPLGIAVVGGLVVSQLLTLYVTPVVYTALDDLQAKLSRRRSREG